MWDKIISSKEAAKDIEEIFLSKYRLVDNGRDLRGRDVNITLAWNVMPYIGKKLDLCVCVCVCVYVCSSL